MQKMKRLLWILAAMTAVLCPSGCNAQIFKPVMPKVQETPLPTPVTLPTPPASTAEVPNRPLSADEAAQIALHNQPNVNIAQSAGYGRAGGNASCQVGAAALCDRDWEQHSINRQRNRRLWNAVHHRDNDLQAAPEAFRELQPMLPSTSSFSILITRGI